MAYGTFQLGSFNFAGITGSLSLAGPVERLRIEDRVGVDGFEITTLGKRGQISRLQTFRDIDDWEDGFQLFEDYRAYIGQGPKALTVNSFPLASVGFNVVVLDVQKIAHYESPTIIGNKLESSPTAVLEAAWTVMTRPI